ncbi:hypothetical protein Trydic_g8255 [Trypoxylus dichotomus]
MGDTTSLQCTGIATAQEEKQLKLVVLRRPSNGGKVLPPRKVIGRLGEPGFENDALPSSKLASNERAGNARAGARGVS